MKQCLIIDGSSLLFRAFFALPPMQGPEGQPTNAVLGFINMLMPLIQENEPTYIAVAFDAGRKTFRNELYGAYKANRDKAPDELRSQFGLIKEVLDSMGILTIEMEGWEGDDIIGTLSARFASDDLSVIVVSGDRDTLQLVDDKTTVQITKKGIKDLNVVTPKNIEELYGYRADQVVELKALMGDTSDNIPGIPGVGEKTALKLIGEYGTVENLYANIEGMKASKMKDKIAENKELVEISKDLATIRRDVPLDTTLEDCVPKMKVQALDECFARCGFHRVLQRVKDTMALFGSTGSKREGYAFLTDCYGSQDREELATVGDLQEKTGPLSIMLEYEDKKSNPKIIGVYASRGLSLVRFSPENKGAWEDLATLMLTVNTLYTSDAHTIFQQLRHYVGDWTALGQKLCALEAKAYGAEENKGLFDLFLLAYLLNPGSNTYDVENLWVDYGQLHYGESIDGKDKALHCLAMAPLAWAIVDAVKEAEASYADDHYLALWQWYSTKEIPLLFLLLRMEQTGIKVNREALDTLYEEYSAEEEKLCAKIYELAGEKFTISSPKQLGHILFEVLDLPGKKKTKTGYSTKAEILQDLVDKHPIVEYILQYRMLTKLISTYLVGLKKELDGEDCIHTSFNQAVTATGRLSSSEPNLQNIPAHTDKGKEIRSLFVPRQGFDYIVSADYSQLELRVLATLSQDEKLLKAFAEGADIHQSTAAEVLGKPMSEVTKEERSHAKAVNYGLIYGMTEFGLAKGLRITADQARFYIETFFSRYPKIHGFMDGVLAQVRASGVTFTEYGRLRKVPDIHSSNRPVREGAERAAMNTVIQGTAADIMKDVMLFVDKRLVKEGLKSRILLQVHDELVLEVTKDEVDRVKTILEEEMCMLYKKQSGHDFDLYIDIHCGDNWAEAK